MYKTSPIYNIQKVSIYDICAQEVNPNYMTDQAFSSLQTSIFNNGWLQSITIGKNPDYDESKQQIDNLSKIKSVLKAGGNISCSGETSFSIETNDKKIRKLFKYTVIDGQQRSSIIRLGTYFYLLDNGYINESDIRSGRPGREMLKWLALQENFTIPSVIIDTKDHDKNMATTMIMNQSRGNHRFDTTKKIIYELINKGKSIDWISKNICMDKSSINRIMQINGLRSAYDNIDESKYYWNPENDISFIKKNEYYQRRERINFIKENSNENCDFDNLIEQSNRIGYKEHNVRETHIELAPNGTRRQGRIINGYIPK